MELKKSANISALFAFIILLSSCGNELTSTEVQEFQPCKAVDATVYQDHVIVQFGEGALPKVESSIDREGCFVATKAGGALNASLSSAGVVRMERLYPDAGEWEERHREAGLHLWYRVYFDRQGVSPSDMVAEMEALGDVLYAEAERKAHIAASYPFNDPQYYQMWHLNNEGRYYPGAVAGADINVEPVWAGYTTGSSEVIVSVVDGGIQLDHPDLDGVILPGGIDGSKNFWRGNYKIEPTSHGTHVAGTIAAINNNRIAGCGIAGGSDGKGGVRIINSQVFGEGEGESAYNFAEAMVWGADHGAVISQNSWGNVFETEAEAKRGNVGYMKSAIDYFIAYAGLDARGKQVGPMKGGVVIFAAGNDNWSIGWPAAYDNPKCLAVGSINAMGQKSNFSNYGDWVDICAPGGDTERGQVIFSTLPGGGFGGMAGTSMACPHVSGVAALIVSYFGGPGFTNDQLVDRLLGGANYDIVKSARNIGPLVDAYGSFKYGAQTPPDKIEEYSVSASGNTVGFEWKVPSDADGEVAFGCVLLYGKDRSAFNELNPAKLPSAVSAKFVGTPSGARVGDVVSDYVDGLDFETTYYVSLASYDYSKNYSELSEVKTVKTKKNDPPVITTDYEGDYKVKCSKTLEVDFHIYDPNRHEISVEFSPGSRAASSVQLDGDVYRLTIEGAGDDAGSYTASYKVVDSYGLETEYVIDYTLLPNHPPVIIKQVENMYFATLNKTVELDMSEYISDEDEETLVYEASHTNSRAMYVNQVGNTLMLTSLNWGADEVSIVGRDTRGAEITLEFRSLVRREDADADIYPSAVSDYLKISGGQEAETFIQISTSTGSIVLSYTVMTDAFNPAVIDMRNCAPGNYVVKVIINGKTTIRNIVKL